MNCASDFSLDHVLDLLVNCNTRLSSIFNRNVENFFLSEPYMSTHNHNFSQNGCRVCGGDPNPTRVGLLLHESGRILWSGSGRSKPGRIAADRVEQFDSTLSSSTDDSGGRLGQRLFLVEAEAPTGLGRPLGPLLNREQGGARLGCRR